MTEEYFNEVYAKTNKLLLAKIMTFSDSDFQTAQDVLQKVYLKFFEALPRDIDETKVISWLSAVAKNLTMRHLNYVNAAKRKVEYYPSVASSKPEEGDRKVNIILEYPDQTALTGFEEMLEREQAAKRTKKLKLIKKVVNQLPNKQKKAVALFYFKNYKIKKIAEVTGNKVNNVCVLLNAARENLKNLLINV
jgi:RNA polymerase sigma-70 factor (ECF subfamily)